MKNITMLAGVLAVLIAGSFGSPLRGQAIPAAIIQPINALPASSLYVETFSWNTGSNATAEWQSLSVNGTSGFDMLAANGTFEGTIGFNNPANATELWNLTSAPVLIGVNNATVANFTTTGEVVTGTVTATGGFSSSGNSTGVVMAPPFVVANLTTLANVTVYTPPAGYTGDVIGVWLDVVNATSITNNTIVSFSAGATGNLVISSKTLTAEATGGAYYLTANASTFPISNTTPLTMNVTNTTAGNFTVKAQPMVVLHL